MEKSIELILSHAYLWHSADIHAAACRLGWREDKDGTADKVAAERLVKLRLMLDFFKQVHGDV